MGSKHEPMFISRSETFKFVASDTIVLPCEVANTGKNFSLINLKLFKQKHGGKML